MDRPPPENIPEPIPRDHRREHRLHEEARRHGAPRYEAQARDPQNREGGGGNHTHYYQFYWDLINRRWIWLRPVRLNRTRARCIVCHRNFNADIKTVGRHERSRHHRRLIARFRVPEDNEYEPHLTIDEFRDEEARVKLLIAAYFASEGIAHIKINTLLPLMKEVARYPNVLYQLKLTRWDLSKIISKVIAPVHKRQLAETLSETKFSILFDESTGINKDKHGCLLIRFADNRSYLIRTVLWDLIPIYREDDEHSNETAESLFHLIVNSLFGRQLANEEHRVVLRRENLMASGSDGCNTMIGVNNSVARRLFDHFPGINHITCPCHHISLCGSHAITECPIIIEIVVEVYNWFCSSKRLHALIQNQIRLNLDLHKLLRFVHARWLTGLPALVRLEEQLPAIDATLAENPNNEQAMQLLVLLRLPIIRCLIAFFTFILEVVADANGWMQSEEVIFPEMFGRIVSDFKDIVLCYMNPEHVENANLLEFDTENVQHFLPDDDMLIGNNARLLAQALPPDQYNDCMRVIRQYLVHLATEWLERLVIPWARYQCTESLLVENALSEDFHQRHPEIIHDLVTTFLRAVPAGVEEEMLQEQWENLLVLQEIDFEIPLGRTDYFWFTVKNITNIDGLYPFAELADFALNILCTPHSNAQPERVWSWEKYFKNKYRNLLSLASVKGSFFVKDCLRLQGCIKSVHKFQPSDEMIIRVRYRLYDNGVIDEEDAIINELEVVSDSEGEIDEGEQE